MICNTITFHTAVTKLQIIINPKTIKRMLNNGKMFAISTWEEGKGEEREEWKGEERPNLKVNEGKFTECF